VFRSGMLPALRGAIPEQLAIVVVPTLTMMRAAFSTQKAEVKVGPRALDGDVWLAGFPPLAIQSAGQRTSVTSTSGMNGRPKAVVRDPVFGESAQKARVIRLPTRTGLDRRIHGLQIARV
jgi:hypothetical protein